MNGIKLSAVNEPMTSALDAYLFLMGVPALIAYTKEDNATDEACEWQQKKRIRNYTPNFRWKFCTGRKINQKIKNKIDNYEPCYNIHSNLVTIMGKVGRLSQD
jgi:hypothetical protein